MRRRGRDERARNPPTDEGGEPAAPESFSYRPLDPDGEPIEPIPADIELYFEDYLELDYVPERIELGRQLFHDPRLSSDNTLSCASCHDLRYAGVDRAKTATGVRGQVGYMNTPSVFNAVFHLGQFWNGRAPNLESQADGPPNAPTEMASSWAQISAKLEEDARMLGLFRAAFVDADLSQGIKSEYLQHAIADFERTLITPNSPFDHYLLGDDSAVGDDVKEGYQIFKDVGCVECHSGMAVGGGSYQLLGRSKAFFADCLDAHGGRYEVTGEEKDRHVFKVGSLRNVALTAPYLHDGSVESLEEVIRIMSEYQLGRDLSDEQVSRVAVFLRSLTGEYGGQRLDEIQNTVRFPKSTDVR